MNNEPTDDGITTHSPKTWVAWVLLVLFLLSVSLNMPAPIVLALGAACWFYSFGDNTRKNTPQ